MHHKLGIKPYNKYSRAAKDIRRALGLAKYNPTHSYGLLVNYGCLRNDNNSGVTLNKEVAIKIARNKVTTFKLLQENGIRVPKFTINIDEARTFKFPVLCRANFLSQGKGIHIAKNEHELVLTDFYTQYINKKVEYRVHVFKGKVIGWSKKIPKQDGSNNYIWNHSQGYKFRLQDNNRIYSKLAEYAIKSVNLCGLDFGSVDIVQSEKGNFFVLEVNSASGIEGTILREYVNNIKREVFNNARFY